MLAGPIVATSHVFGRPNRVPSSISQLSGHISSVALPRPKHPTLYITSKHLLPAVNVVSEVELWKILHRFQAHRGTNHSQVAIDHLASCLPCCLELLVLGISTMADYKRGHENRAKSSALMVTNVHSRRLRLEFSRIYRIISPSNRSSLLLAISKIVLTGEFISCGARVSSPRPATKYLLYHCSHAGQTSQFSFLRHYGPRRLPPSRKIIVNQDGFLITHIGQGSFARIARVWHRPSGHIRVMKRMSLDPTGLALCLVRTEVEALEAMEGNCWFPPLLGHFNDGEDVVITMPYYQRGDLAGLIAHKGYLGRELAQFYCAELITAIQYLHRKGFIHRDIKPDNIFLDDEGHLVLADLGLAERIAPLATGGQEVRPTALTKWTQATTRNPVGDDFPFLWASPENPFGTRGVSGTHWYTAPEVFRAERYSFGVDYWSVGVIYYELITGHLPFNYYRPYPKDKRPTLDFRIKPNQLLDIEDWEKTELLRVLHDDPAHRYQSIVDIKNSRIFIDVDWTRFSTRDVLPPHLPQPLREHDFGFD